MFETALEYSQRPEFGKMLQFVVYNSTCVSEVGNADLNTQLVDNKFRISNL